MTMGALFTFGHCLRVRWGECDMQGIVFNPHYMAYVDVALTEYWRTIGVAYPQMFTAEGVDTFMVAASQSFREAARFDDELEVALRVARIGTTSLGFSFEIGCGGRLLFDGEATYVIANNLTRRPVPVADWLAEAIMLFERETPLRKGAAQRG